MKSFYLLIFALLLSVAATAKGSGAMVTIGPTIGGPFPHFDSQVTGGGSSTPSPSKVSLRLIGRTETRYKGNAFVPVDSFSYEYDGDMGGVLNNEKIDNDESLMYSLSYSYIYDINNMYQNRLRRTQKYNADGTVSNLTYSPWITAANDWKDSSRYLYSYVNQKMTTSTFEQFYANIWTQAIESNLTYSGQNVTAMESPVYKVSFDYDANSNLTQMIDAEYVANGWHNKERNEYQYNGKNLVARKLSEWNNQGQYWQYSKQWVYVYNGQDVESLTEMVWNGLSWVNSSKHIYTYDVSQNKLNDTWQIWTSGNFINVSKEDWIYNGQNLPTQITTSTWNNGAWVYTTNDKQYRFYYQNYFPTDVKNVANIDHLNTYPIPATDVLNIQMEWRKVENFTVTLCGIDGAVLQTWLEAPTTYYNRAVSVAQYPAGIYFLRIDGENTHLAERVMINH